MAQQSLFGELLATGGYVRQPQLLGQPAVSAQQAAKNKRQGRSPTRPRNAIPGVLPFSSATLWRKVKAHTFPAPVKLSERVTAWRVDDVLAWMQEHA